jgi:hypothetical protein
MIVSVHQPQYIPWLGYFDKIDKSDCFVFLDQVQYKQREYQNRNRICNKNGWIWLTVPVISKGLGRQKICNVKVNNDINWPKKHWGSLQNCYRRAPFFKDHYHFFKRVYFTKWERLIDLNIYIIKYLLKELNIKIPLFYESEIGTSSRATDRIIEICKKLKADTYLSGIGGKSYLEEIKFSQAGIKLVYQKYIHPSYNQLYIQGFDHFLPNMSAIDLLFNEGGKSLSILRGEYGVQMKNLCRNLHVAKKGIKSTLFDFERSVRV